LRLLAQRKIRQRPRGMRMRRVFQQSDRRRNAFPSGSKSIHQATLMPKPSPAGRQLRGRVFTWLGKSQRKSKKQHKGSQGYDINGLHRPFVPLC
jgi:hypothetical protein